MILVADRITYSEEPIDDKNEEIVERSSTTQHEGSEPGQASFAVVEQIPIQVKRNVERACNGSDYKVGTRQTEHDVVCVMSHLKEQQNGRDDKKVAKDYQWHIRNLDDGINQVGFINQR